MQSKEAVPSFNPLRANKTRPCGVQNGTQLKGCRMKNDGWRCILIRRFLHQMRRAILLLTAPRDEHLTRAITTTYAAHPVELSFVVPGGRHYFHLQSPPPGPSRSCRVLDILRASSWARGRKLTSEISETMRSQRIRYLARRPYWTTAAAAGDAPW